MAETQIIMLDDLRKRCGGKTKTMIRVLESFVAVTPQFVAKLQQEEIQQDFVQLAKTLHSIKGLLGEIAALDGAEFVQELEVKVRNSIPLNAEEVSAVAEHLNSACVSAKHAEEVLRLAAS